MQAVDAVQSYFRRQLALGALADPAVRRALLPPGMPKGLPWPLQQLLDWFADYMGCKLMRRLATKYPEDGAVTEEQVRGVWVTPGWLADGYPTHRSSGSCMCSTRQGAAVDACAAHKHRSICFCRARQSCGYMPADLP
jgi:hypothetical protein